MLEVMLALQLKHFVIDFPLQGPYQYKNKGTYGHPGGILHSGLHGLATLAIFVFFVSWPVAIIALLIDSLVHYHIDWAKMNLNNRLGLTPTNSEKFWWLLGLDQLLHQLTYIGLLLLI